jgi:hypothetical protein
MSKRELDKSEYPYDRAECGFCATQHAYSSFSSCYKPEHAEMKREADTLGLANMLHAETFRDMVLAFREKFAKFYKENSDE